MPKCSFAQNDRLEALRLLALAECEIASIVRDLETARGLQADSTRTPSL
jgi:uncharacterized membrane protein